GGTAPAGGPAVGPGRTEAGLPRPRRATEPRPRADQRSVAASGPAVAGEASRVAQGCRAVAGDRARRSPAGQRAGRFAHAGFAARLPARPPEQPRRGRAPAAPWSARPAAPRTPPPP